MVAHGACHTTRKKLPPLELERRWRLFGPQSMMMCRKVTEPQKQPLKGGCQDQGTQDQQPGFSNFRLLPCHGCPGAGRRRARRPLHEVPSFSNGPTQAA